MTTTAAGMTLIRDAGSLLERSARTLTSPANQDLAGAVTTDVVTARLMFASGTLLLRESDEQARRLLDIFA